MHPEKSYLGAGCAKLSVDTDTDTRIALSLKWSSKTGHGFRAH